MAAPVLTDEEMGFAPAAPEASGAAPAILTDKEMGFTPAAAAPAPWYTAAGVQEMIGPNEPVPYSDTAGFLDTVRNTFGPTARNMVRGVGRMAADPVALAKGIVTLPMAPGLAFGRDVLGAELTPGQQEVVAGAEEQMRMRGLGGGIRGVVENRGLDMDAVEKTLREAPETVPFDASMIAGLRPKPVVPVRMKAPKTVVSGGQEMVKPPVTLNERLVSAVEDVGTFAKNPVGALRTGAADVLEGGARGLAEKAIKPSKARGKLARAEMVIDEFLKQKDSTLSRDYLEMLAEKIDGVDNVKTEYFDTLRGGGHEVKLVPEGNAYRAIDAEIASAGPDGKALLIAERAKLEALLAPDVIELGVADPALGGISRVVPADALQRAKMRTGRDLKSTAYGTEKGATTEGKKAVVRGLKDAVAEAYPEFQELNKREQRLITLQEALQPAVGRAESRNPIGLGTIGAAGVGALTHGGGGAGAAAATGVGALGIGALPATIVGGMIGHQLENPAALARNAHRLKRVADAVRPDPDAPPRPKPPSELPPDYPLAAAPETPEAAAARAKVVTDQQKWAAEREARGQDAQTAQLMDEQRTREIEREGQRIAGDLGERRAVEKNRIDVEQAVWEAERADRNIDRGIARNQIEIENRAAAADAARAYPEEHPAAAGPQAPYTAPGAPRVPPATETVRRLLRPEDRPPSARREPAAGPYIAPDAVMDNPALGGPRAPYDPKLSRRAPPSREVTRRLLRREKELEQLPEGETMMRGGGPTTKEVTDYLQKVGKSSVKNLTDADVAVIVRGAGRPGDDTYIGKLRQSNPEVFAGEVDPSRKWSGTLDDALNGKFIGRNDQSSGAAAPEVNPNPRVKLKLHNSEAALFNKIANAKGVTAEMIARAKRDALAHIESTPPSAFERLRVDKVEVEQRLGKPPLIKVSWEKAPYGFDQAPGVRKATPTKPLTGAEKLHQEQFEQKIADMVLADFDRLVDHSTELTERGLVARNILSHVRWDTEIARQLREQMGPAYDPMADLLGATSPKTGAAQNWRYANEAMDLFLRGKYDAQLLKLKSLMEQAQADAGKKALAQSKKKKPPAPASLSTILKQHPEIDFLSETNAKFGTNTSGVAEALLGLFRDVAQGDAPKARNFALNIAELSDRATIDVWMARYLQEKAGKKLLPPSAEMAVSGTHGPGPGFVIDGQFGFGVRVFEDAVKKINQKYGTNLKGNDLQAVQWMDVKRDWTERGIQGTEVGEGGSFESGMRASPGNLHQIGVSTTSSAEGVTPRGRANPDPTVQHQASFINRMRDFIFKEPDVKMPSVRPSYGIYAGWPEKSFDFNFHAKDNFKVPDTKGTSGYTRLRERLLKELTDENQYNAHIARRLRHGEVSANARPGVSVLFKEPLTMEQAQTVLEAANRHEVFGATLSVDLLSKDLAGVGTGEMPQTFTGFTIISIPEYVIRARVQNWDSAPSGKVFKTAERPAGKPLKKLFDTDSTAYRNLTSGDPVRVMKLVREQKRKMQKLVADLNGMSDIRNAELGVWDVDVIAREEAWHGREGRIGRQHPRAGKGSELRRGEVLAATFAETARLYRERQYAAEPGGSVPGRPPAGPLRQSLTGTTPGATNAPGALKLSAQDIPPGLEISVMMVRGKTGKKVRVKMDARKAFADGLADEAKIRKAMGEAP